jgi:hypothetical protein
VGAGHLNKFKIDFIDKRSGIEKYPAFCPKRKYVESSGGSHLEGLPDMLLTLDFAQIRRLGKLGILFS